MRPRDAEACRPPNGERWLSVMNQALTRRVLRTDDREMAESTISNLYEPTGIEVAEPDIAVSLHAATLETVTAGTLQMKQPSRVYGRMPAGVYFISTPVRGQVMCGGGGVDPQVTTPGWASMWTPGQVPDTLWNSGAALMSLKVPAALFDSEFDDTMGVARPDTGSLAPTVNLQSSTGRSWCELVAFLARELLGNSSLLQQRTARNSIERLLVEGFLLAYQQQSGGGRTRPVGAGVSAAKRAMELIEEDPAEPWTVLALARRVHVSVRALQEGFHGEYGTTPMTHLRQVRLRRVHEDLTARPTSSTTVQDVARRWGFLHLGRFAAHYRCEFGERPSETLRRSVLG